MKSSPFIRWAKSRSGIRYNLGHSGAPRLTAHDLGEEDCPELSGRNLDGWPPLLQAIAARYDVSIDQVVTTHGNSMANHLVCAALLEPGDGVVVEKPCYEPLHLLPEYFGAVVSFFQRRAEDRFDVDPEAVEAQVNSTTKLVILSNLHNPSGASISRQSLNALARLADHYDFYVLVDEAYLEFLHGGYHRTAALISPRFLSTRSLTKAFGLDGLRLGWIVASSKLSEKLRHLNDLFSISTAHPSERLALRALQQAEDLLMPQRNLADRNRWTTDSFITTDRFLEWVKPPSGTIGWVRLKEGSVDDLVQHLETEYETTLAPGRFFGDESCFRIGFGVPPEDLREGLERLRQALRDEPALEEED
ncbi:MAG TPA: pyridoxal phosphate-dependent aminotransferase [Acidobacteriota bacterium]|nr:pyridoxal phosphate-dependent aminotransferase [Acidobacteriota bacterium]